MPRKLWVEEEERDAPGLELLPESGEERLPILRNLELPIVVTVSDAWVQQQHVDRRSAEVAAEGLR
jgi:hypothetical protein